MELTEEQLKIVERQLTDFFPQSQQIHGYIAIMNRMKGDPIHVILDSWPEHNVILCKPHYEQKSDHFKDVCVFSKDEASLKKVLTNTNVIDWNNYLCLGIDAIYMDMLLALTSERHLPGNNVAVCHMMTLHDLSYLPYSDSSAISVTSLDESHVHLINNFWKFGEGENSIRMIRNMIRHFPSCCVLNTEGHPVSWLLTYPSGAIGMLFTQPDHRGKGYAKVLVSSVARRLHAQGLPVYCFIEEENTLSYELFKSLGFIEEPSYRAAWFLLTVFEVISCQIGISYKLMDMLFTESHY